MMKKIYILFLLLGFSGCVEDSDKPAEAETSATAIFDAERWKIREAEDYPYRDKMLEDLMNSEQILDDRGLRDLKREEIVELLGEPTRTDTNYLFYRITQKRLGMWPLHTKTMVIELAADSTVNWVKIHE